MTPPAAQIVVVLTTIPDELDGDGLAQTLVQERLAACVSVMPAMQSVYRWNGHVEQAGERQLLIKTAGDRVGALRQRLHALHPYEVPEFVVLAAAGGSDAYLGWIEAETRPPGE